MLNVSVIRTLAAAAIGVGALMLTWFNRLSHEEQEQVESRAREKIRAAVDKLRESFERRDPPGPSPLPA